MCGITGFYRGSLFSNSELVRSTVEVMSNALNLRGPDSSGIWVSELDFIALGHRRLAIQDLTCAGHQPMVSDCGRYVISFNGEIYNHADLRLALDKGDSPKAWRGHSDTETILQCFSKWGIDKTLKALAGMFALALWDSHTKSITIARDRFGEKPVYIGWRNSTFLFGSELKALRKFPEFGFNIDRAALSELLLYNYVPAPRSIFLGIKKLPPGHFITITKDTAPGTINFQCYWSLSEVIENGLKTPFLGSDADAIDALEAHLKQSVKAQMLSDVPLGAFLSGGVDSSAVVAMMQAQGSHPVQTFAIGFSDENYNEANDAKEVAHYLGTKHTEFYIGPNEAIELIPRLPQIYCEPFADSSQIPTYLVSKMAREHVTVALTGDGGDELFGGYNTYQLLPKIWEQFSRLPLPIRKAIKFLLAGLPPSKRLQKLQEIILAKTPFELHRLASMHWDPAERIVIGGGLIENYHKLQKLWEKCNCFESGMMAIDTQIYMSDDILVKVDRSAMSNSLETRVPLLDHRLVEFAWRLPIDMKIRGGQGKWALRQVLYRYVPRELIERPKKGFSIPLGEWLRGPLRDWAEALLDEARLRREGYFNPAPIRSAWYAHLHKNVDNAHRLWSVLMFQAWLEEQAHV